MPDQLYVVKLSIYDELPMACVQRKRIDADRAIYNVQPGADAD